jgi:hypothetical protein
VVAAKLGLDDLFFFFFCRGLDDRLEGPLEHVVVDDDPAATALDLE